MRTIRLFHSGELALSGEMELDDEARRHLVTVLRATQGQSVELFNGDGFNYLGSLSHIEKRRALVTIQARTKSDNESPISLHLYQAVSRGDKMDLTIQKAVELGVNQITPITTERCGVKLNDQRWLKKVQHWQKVIQSACEQSGRAVVPQLNTVIGLDHLIASKIDFANTIVLDPVASDSLSKFATSAQALQVVIGPEGGLTEQEIQRLRSAGCQGVRLGPRVLRTETAGLAVLSVLQARFGDW
jgi:16S rRNA (uracil1498-N3)-methyltransferase